MRAWVRAPSTRVRTSRATSSGSSGWFDEAIGDRIAEGRSEIAAVAAEEFGDLFSNNRLEGGDFGADAVEWATVDFPV
jgi:hypothetical protein